VLSLCRAGSRAQARLDLARRWEAPPRAPAGVARPIYLPRRATWEADSCGRPSSAAVSHNLRFAATRVVGARRRAVAQGVRAPALPATPCPSTRDTHPATGVAHRRTRPHTPYHMGRPDSSFNSAQRHRPGSTWMVLDQADLRRGGLNLRPLLRWRIALQVSWI